MTRIEFHFNVAERLHYTCRLLRKAYLQGARLGVLGSEATLRQLDVALWKFSEVEFLPHSTATDSPELQQTSPIRLHADVQQLVGLDVLLNLDDELPPAFEKFGRLIEIVSLDDFAIMNARKRWRHYKELGYELQRHDLAKVSAP